MKKIMIFVSGISAIAIIALSYWQRSKLRQDLQEEIGVIDMMISKHEAKTQFINDHLPIVHEYTGSEIVAKRILAAVYDNSVNYGLSPGLILSVIKVESEFNPRAYSAAGAIGLMQIMPVTGIYIGRSLGLWVNNERDLYDIEKNIQIGVVFLKECIERLGEKNGLGYYYAGNNTQHYTRYAKRIDVARESWIVHRARDGA